MNGPGGSRHLLPVRVIQNARPADPAEPAAGPTAVPSLTSMRKIAVLRALNLGDMMCAVPALRSLRAAAPHASITLIGLPWAAAFVRRFHHYLDHFVAFPGFPGMPERRCEVSAIPPFLAALQTQRYDLAIQLHGSGEASNLVTALFGAAHCAGFHPIRQGPGHGIAQTVSLRWEESEHEILRGLRLMQALGAPSLGEDLDFPTAEADCRLLQRCAGHLPPATRYAVIHPGASLASRRWPPARFAQVADALAAGGLDIVLTGTAGEAPLTKAVAARMTAPALDLAGRTDLGALAVLLRDARLLVCNDTGVSHVGAAVGTPSVVICCGADPARFAPLDRVRHVVLSAPVDCRPCMVDVCPIGQPCALAVSADDVVDAAIRVLEQCPRVKTPAGRAGPHAGQLRMH